MAADTAEQAPEETTPQPEQWPPTRHLTVDEAMVAVMREIGGVGKNGYNKAHDYTFRAQEDIVAAVRGPMAKYGLRMLPRVLKAEHYPRGKSHVAILHVEYIVRGPAGDVMEPSIIVVGEGADVSDKGTNKAMTAAKKYALIQAFEIASDNVADSDRTSPDTQSSPLDQYLAQIQNRAVWYNHAALGRVRQRAIENGHANLTMPDGLTLLDTLDAQGAELLRQMEENERRHGQEREARDGQMRAEHPEYHRASPDDEVWQTKGPARQQQPRADAPPALPDAVDVERQLAEAMKDPQTAVKRLNEIRKHFTAAVLKRVPVQTKWGQVDGNSAITFALREIAQQGPQRRPDPVPDSPPAPPGEEQRTPEPSPALEPEPEPEDAPPPPEDPESPVAEEPAGEPQAPAPEPSEPQESPAPPMQPAPQPRPAQRPDRKASDMTKAERGRDALEREAEFQAQMLGKSTLDYVAHLLSAGASSIEDIKGNFGLQGWIVENRPAVVAALIESGMPRQAEVYASLGQRAPALNIAAIIKGALQPQTSF